MSFISSHNPLRTGDTVDVTFYLNSKTTLTNLVTILTFPAGSSYVTSSSVVSAGTFDDISEWDLPTLTGDPTLVDGGHGTGEETLTVTVQIDDIDVFSAGTRDVSGTTATVTDEIVTANNTAHNIIDTVTCTDFNDCLLGDLNEYDSMDLAIADLGGNRLFLASLENIEGWSYRALLVTPPLIG